MTKGRLFLIPVPIAEEATDTIPKQVTDAAFQLKYFVVERLKTARRMLRSMGYQGDFDTIDLKELDKHEAHIDYRKLLEPALKGSDMGLMSEAGCPAVADPGSELVREAHAQGIQVIPLVGPSSILLALMASGMNGQQFCFKGYLPYKKGELERSLKQIEQDSVLRKETQIFIEAPYRNKSVIEYAVKVLNPKTQFAVASELNGVHEFVRSANIGQWKRMKAPDIHKKTAIFLIQA